jgi:hypothetical protein
MACNVKQPGRNGGRRRLWMLTGASLITLVLRFWPAPRLERLQELPMGALPLAVHSGKLFYSNDGLWTVPVRGGKAQSLGVRMDTRPEALRPIPTAGGLVVPLAPEVGALGEKVVRLAEVPYDGSPPRPYIVEMPLAAASFTVFQGASYSAAPSGAPGKAPMLGGGTGTFNPHSAPIKVSATGIAADPQGELTFSVSDETLSSLYGAGTARRSVIHISRDPNGTSSVNQGGAGRRILHRGRLFWLNRDSLNENLWSLVSSLPGGSGTRRVTSLEDHPPLFTWMVQKGDSLYYCAVAPDPRRARLVRLSEPSFNPTPVTPEFSAPFSFVWIDGAYLYFATREDRENWLDWSALGLRVRSVAVLNRYRLE